MPPEDAGTEVREKREMAEELKKKVAAEMLEQEALARLEKKQEEEQIPESGDGEMKASEAR